MIWIINGKESFQIVGTNIHVRSEGRHELWATKPSGKTIQLLSSESNSDPQDYKDAIDYAISKGTSTFQL